MVPPSSLLSSWAPSRKGWWLKSQRLAFGEALLDCLGYICHSSCLPIHFSLCTKGIFENPTLLCYSQTPTSSTQSGLVGPWFTAPVSLLPPLQLLHRLYSVPSVCPASPTIGLCSCSASFLQLHIWVTLTIISLGCSSIVTSSGESSSTLWTSCLPCFLTSVT